MTAATLELLGPRGRLGLKGPRAAEWLTAQGIVVPAAPNTWAFGERTCVENALVRTADAVDAPGAVHAMSAPGKIDAAGSANAADTANTANTANAADEADGLLVARLGAGEYFLEDGPHRAEGSTVARLSRNLDGNPPGVYPVLREDCAFLLRGDAVHEVLAQVCPVDFAQLSLESRPLIMTLMIGVAVLVVPENAAAGRRYRIWCDPSFGAYLGGSLGEIVLECGGRYTGVPA